MKGKRALGYKPLALRILEFAEVVENVVKPRAKIPDFARALLAILVIKQSAEDILNGITKTLNKDEIFAPFVPGSQPSIDGSESVAPRAAGQEQAVLLYMYENLETGITDAELVFFMEGSYVRKQVWTRARRGLVKKRLAKNSKTRRLSIDPDSDVDVTVWVLTPAGVEEARKVLRSI